MTQSPVREVRGPLRFLRDALLDIARGIPAGLQLLGRADFWYALWLLFIVITIVREAL